MDKMENKLTERKVRETKDEPDPALLTVRTTADEANLADLQKQRHRSFFGKNRYK